MTTRILVGDCREVLKTLPSDSVHCCVTSPPYWGLRSYLPVGHPDKPKEIGSEATLDEWVQTMVEVFREVRRVLRPDGTLFLNLGDAYAGSRCGGSGWPGSTLNGKQTNASAEAKRQMTVSPRRDKVQIPRSDVTVAGLKPKDLMGQPWRVALALQADGWWLRQEIIWAKKNPMPESSRDRFTKAHEHVFMLSKSERYYFDFEAVQEPCNGGAKPRTSATRPVGTGVGFGHGTDAQARGRGRVKPGEQGVGRRQGPPGNPAENEAPATPKAALDAPGARNNASFDAALATMPATRNPRDVRFVDEDEWAQFQAWKQAQAVAPDVLALSSEPFRGAHFATYPTELIRPFIEAGCPAGGTVLDPFGGSGTTGLEADRQHKDAILIDLDARNAPMARERITKDAGMFGHVEVFG